MSPSVRSGRSLLLPPNGFWDRNHSNSKTHMIPQQRQKRSFAAGLAAFLLAVHLIAAPWEAPLELLDRPYYGDGEAEGVLSDNNTFFTGTLWLEASGNGGPANKYVHWRQHGGFSNNTDVWSSNNADAVSTGFGASNSLYKEVKGYCELTNGSAEVSSMN